MGSVAMLRPPPDTASQTQSDVGPPIPFYLKDRPAGYRPSRRAQAL